MDIEFERTEEDMVEFNLFHINHSPTIKRQLFAAQITMAVLIFIASMYIVYLQTRYLPVISYVAGAVLSIGVGLIYPYIYKQRTIKQARKLFREGSNKSLLGRHEMQLSPDGIRYKTIASESKTNWSSIEKVLQNDKFIFMYIGAINAFVVPKSAFASSEKQKEFLDYVNSNVNQASRSS
ncbi:MAG: YcxB family protein [Anaerolineales bacterium]